MIPSTVLCEKHFGKPVLREAEPIELARVPVNGNRLQDSIILHPRYVPRGVEHELFSARVYRRGRTVDLFLDEPIEVDGDEYGILNFKGVGANASDTDDELLVNTDRWYDSRYQEWMPRGRGDCFGRVWGTLTSESGREEFTAEIFHTHGIQHIPHVTLNPIPPEITRSIQQICHGTEKHDFVQLVRACKTNVRIDDFSRVNQKRQYQHYTPEWVERIAEIDAAILNAQLTLVRTGRMLVLNGITRQNRFIDGLFTDVENYEYRDFQPYPSVLLPSRVMSSSTSALVPSDKWVSYHTLLEQRTGVSLMNPAFPLYQYLQSEFAKMGGKV